MKKDYSTINQGQLSKLPAYKKPPTYHLGDEGNACAGDPPGFPTYFTQSVYTQHGNTPGRGPSMVLLGHVLPERGWDETGEKSWERLLSRLWVPLPIDHPRTRAWIVSLYRHSAHCYIDRTKPPRADGRLVIWPVPGYALRSFRDDPRFSDEWRQKEKESIEQANAEIIEAARKICTPENHSAVVQIQEHYPDYQPEIDLIENPPQHYPGDWWERHDEPPAPEDCPGLNFRPRITHPTGGTWCQFCGWHE